MTYRYEPIFYPDDLAALRKLLPHGDMETISDEALNEAWTDFSGFNHASFLIPSQTTVAGLVAYLLICHYTPGKR